MRVVLIAFIILLSSLKLQSQADYRSMDFKTYDYYLRGDFKNLLKTADTMLKAGLDYYYLRMRLAITAFNKERYKIAGENFRKALEFNSYDTLSREYIYYSYIYSGREQDAGLYLQTIPETQRNTVLRSIKKPGITSVSAGGSFTANDVVLYTSNSYYYESVKNSSGFSATLDSYLGNKSAITVGYSEFMKNGTVYNSTFPFGKIMNFRQQQFYGRVRLFQGIGTELTGFGQVLIYNDVFRSDLSHNEFTAGIGYVRNGFITRGGINFSLNNFGFSTQTSADGFLTLLPYGNLNLYLTTGGMIQYDKIWGATFQVNEEIGLRLSNSVWVEAGILAGNSFLYSRNYCYSVNNSYLSPVLSFYSNIVLFPLKKVQMIITPYFSKYDVYSWDLTNSTKTGRINIDSFGGAIKLVYKFRKL